MTYQEAISYLYSFINYENLYKYSYKKSFDLERVKAFLEFIGNPQQKLQVIHVAGSKGKGSVCAFIVYILREAGFNVGLYTSPHLNDFRERIRILDQTTSAFAEELSSSASADARRSSQRRRAEFEGMISRKEICDLVSKLKPSIDKFNRISKYNALTFFEVYTALAFQYFKDKKVDFVVLETGLGGRLDATNVCSSLLSIITPISFEHTYLLGNTLKEIAYEKASIIKKQNKRTSGGKILVLTSKQDKSVIDVIQKIAKGKNVLLIRQGKDFKFSIKENNSFDYIGLNSKIENLNINLLGRHQIENASLAIASVEALRYHNMEFHRHTCEGDIPAWPAGRRRSPELMLGRRRINIGEQAIRDGLKNCIWPARFEIISKNPLIVLDGAQNSASVKALDKVLKENFPNKRIWIIFGISKDKELRDTCRQISEISNKIILTKSDNLRASEPKDLLRYFRGNSILLTKSTREALNLTKSNANKNDLILVTGSLYLCGEAREIEIN